MSDLLKNDVKTTEKVENVKEVKNEEVKLTPEMEEFFTKRLQSETDKRVTKFLRELESEKEARLSLEKQIEKEKVEKMNEKERAEFERKKYEDALKQRDMELSQKELKWNKSQSLADKKLPSKFLDIVSGQDLDSFEKNVGILNELIESEVQNRLKNKLGNQKSPETTIVSGDKSSLEIQLLEATKKGNMVEAARINRLLYEKQGQ